jgi:hypothetical protein
MNGDTSTRSRRGGPRLPLLTVECSVVSSKNGSLMGIDCTPTREQYLAWCKLTVNEDAEEAQCKAP